MEIEYQAVILVGGLGTRLRPVTELVPKPMVEIEEKPFLEYKLESLKKYGIKNFIFCVGHLGHMITDYFKDGSEFGVNIKYSYEDELLGTAGAIKNAENLLNDKFIMCNGDTFLDVDFKKLIEFHENHHLPFTLVVANATHPKTQELVEIEDNKILRIYKRGTPEHEHHLKNIHKPLINAGAYLFDKEILELIPPNKKVSLEHDIFPNIIGKMAGFFHSGYILDIADRDDLNELKKDVKEGLILPNFSNKQKIIRSRAPVRITFGGGGTDISPYDENYKGMCVGATINRYVYSTLKLTDDKKIKIKSDIINLYGGFETYQEEFDNIDKIEIANKGPLSLIKATILEMQPSHGFDLYVRSDVSPHSGLGASSSLCVSIIGVLNCLRKKNRLTKHSIAETAHAIEQKRMGMRGGRQDQYASVFGGINLYEFNGKDNVRINAIDARKDYILELEKNLLIVYSGRRVDSSGDIHRELEKTISENKEKIINLHEIKDIAVEIEFNLRRGNLKKFGKLLFDGWEKKKKLNPSTTNPYIDALIAEAMANGAEGARLMGAGGGGHLLIYCEPDREHKIKEILVQRGAKPIEFSFDFDGLKVWEADEY